MTHTCNESMHPQFFIDKSGETSSHCQAVAWLWCDSCGCASIQTAYSSCACCGRAAAELESVDEKTVRTHLTLIRAKRWSRITSLQQEAVTVQPLLEDAP